jgi:hypothetical protein
MTMCQDVVQKPFEGTAVKTVGPQTDFPKLSTRPLWIVTWLGLAALFLLCDLTIAPCMRQWGPDMWGALFVYAAAGPLFAQFGVLPAWLALGDRPYWFRLARHWLAAIAAMAAAALGNILANWSSGRVLRIEDGPAMMSLLLVLPALSLAVESPLWILRWVFGWRITRQIDCPPQRKLAIRDIMLATALVAAALALARLSPQFQPGGPDRAFWGMMAVAAAVAVGSSTVLLPPFVWFALGVRSLPMAVLGAAIHAGTLAAIFLAVIAYNRWTFSTTLWGTIGASVTAITFAWGVTVPFWLARFQGYRLICRTS